MGEAVLVVVVDEVDNDDESDKDRVVETELVLETVDLEVVVVDVFEA